MSEVKLNIWVRNEKCQVVDRRGHLHVYDCHHNQVLPTTWFGGGHVEVMVPPGCYIVSVGVVYGNVYPDPAMVVAGCGQKDVCVNIVLTEFKEKQADRPVIILPLAGCGVKVLVPFVQHAIKAQIRPEELRRAVDVVMQAAAIDREQMMAGLNDEIAELEKHIDEFEGEELELAKEYHHALHQLHGFIG